MGECRLETTTLDSRTENNKSFDDAPDGAELPGHLSLASHETNSATRAFESPWAKLTRLLVAAGEHEPHEESHQYNP